jgi:hypothetical protein
MITTKQALEKIKETRDSYADMRRQLDCWWTIQIAYDTGKQWAYPVTDSGRHVVRQLQNIIDPRREDVRVTLNRVHDQVIRAMASLSPQQVALWCKAASGALADRIATDVSNRVLERWIERTGALSIMRDKDRPRCVLGTAGIKRTMNLAKRRKVGEGLELRDYSFRWCHFYPWEIIRDPSATTTNPAHDEQIVIHEKPRTVEWVKQHFGIEVKSETKMGQLLDYQRQINMAYGIGGGYAQSSNQVGVLVYEAYFKVAGGNQEWSAMQLAWCDPGEDKNELHPIGEVRPNPFYGLPLHFFHYDQHVQSIWGVGIPHLLQQGQDLYNLAVTWLARLQQTGTGKWVIEQGTIEKPSEMLNNRVDQPIVWNRQNATNRDAQPPKRDVPPSPSPATMALLDIAPRYMDAAANMSDVQRGITSPRGEAGRAIEAKLTAANAPLDRIRRDDDMEYQRMLFGTLVDLTKPADQGGHLRLDTAKELVGPDINDNDIFTLLSNPPSKSVAAVYLKPSLMYPETPEEKRSGVVSLVSAQIIDAEVAQWSLLEKGIDVDPARGDSVRKQESEIQAMITGQDMPVDLGDNHDWHIRVIRRFIDSPRWHSLDDEQRSRIQDQHLVAHMQAQMELAGFAGGQAQTNPAARPSPPAEAAEQAAGMEAGSVGPSVMVG